VKNLTPLFLPIKTKRAFEEISDQIRQLIYSGVFKPGEKLLSEREFANQFKTGRMVVREALRTLEQSGLIYIKHGSLGGAYVKAPDTTTIIKSISDMIKVGNVTLRELSEARLGIELVILEFAIKRINEDYINLLKKSIENSEKDLVKGKRATEEYLNFHRLLAKSTENSVFEVMIESITDVTKSFLLLLKPNMEYVHRVLNYHKEIYEAIRDKDLKTAKEKMEEHLLDVNRKLGSLVRSKK